MNTSPTAANIFDLSIAIEKEMVAFYCRLRQLFGYLPEIRDFWGGMRDEEIEHIIQLRILQDSLPPEKIFEPVDPAWVEKGTRVLGKIKSSIEEPIADLDQAYELAHEWETAEVNRIFLFLARKFVTGEDRKAMVESMIDHHLEKLMDFLPAYRTVEERQSIRSA